MVDLSVSVVNYNAEPLLRKCLRSLFAHAVGVRFECFVVDNDSREDGSVQMVRDEFPQVQLIEHRHNVGFARANNDAITLARGRYILLLNPDTEVRPGGLDKLLAFMDAHPDIGVLGCVITYPDGSDQGVSGRVFPTPLSFFFGRTTLITRWFPDNPWSRSLALYEDPGATEPYEVDWVSGACMMVRREAIDQAGPLDEEFFMYWEDADWCYRIKKIGWRVLCFHERLVVHHEAGSTRLRFRPIVAFHRSAYRYYRKHINAGRFHPMHIVASLALASRAMFLIALTAVRKLLRRKEAWYRKA